jgi:predicted ATPase/class 3 adenylate cyclase
VPDPGEVTLPTSGALTFLFTDIEGSTRKAHELGEDWFTVLETHHALLRPVFTAHGGVEVSTAGDSFFVVFEDAARAVTATVAMQHAIGGHDWSPHPQVKVRMGLHTGLARFRAHDNDYAGLTVHAASRVESAAAGGQVLITQATLDAARDAWPDGVDTIDLGLHRLKDLPAELQLYQLAADGLAREFPPVRGLDVVRNNVPVPPSTFVGRTDVLARLHRLVDENRLVTIVGSGGTGKTRVALRAATERLARHADGVWFVELAGSVDEPEVVAAFAQALGAREDADHGLLAALLDHVREQSVLLVVDNCEHVLDATAAVVERLLAVGVGVRVVATSREPLELEGERLLSLAPLSVDDDDGGEAVTLLADRIALIQPDFVLDGETLPDAVTIARRLDGLPLALELAAASTTTLSLAEIAQQLDDRFALLTRGKRTAADRQKTLRGAIDWSYSLLTDSEQRLFRRLGVFPAEFDFGVARAVCGFDTDETDDTLTTLTRKSLISESSTTRLRYLESIRAYAREQLDEAGELDDVAERHARYFVDDIDRDQMDRPEWIEVISDDLAAALRWGGDHDRALQLRALVHLQPFWDRKGRWTEGRSVSDAVLAATSDLDIQPRWDALAKVGGIALHQGDRAAARAYFEEAVDVAERVNGADAAQFLLGNLGQIALFEGDVDTAEELLTGALDAAERTENPEAVALCLSHLAYVACQRGDLARAWERAIDAVERAREFESFDLEFSMTTLLGDIARQRGDLSEARRILSDALALARKTNNDDSAVYVLYCLACVEVDDDRAAAARPYLRDAITLGHATGAEADLAESLELAARLVGDASLLATVDAIRDRIGFARPPAELPAYEELRAQLGAAEPLAVDEAVAAALAALAE